MSKAEYAEVIEVLKPPSGSQILRVYYRGISCQIVLPAVTGWRRLFARRFKRYSLVLVKPKFNENHQLTGVELA